MNQILPDHTVPCDDVRSRIIEAAAALIAAGGRNATTTRAVSAAAAVQAPTIYRLFGDMRGLLNAVAEQRLATYVAAKAARVPNPDPVQDLRDGWETHVAFGLAHPSLYAIMNGDQQAGVASPAMAAGYEILRKKVRAIALTGRLRVNEDRATLLMQSACRGTVLTLLGKPDTQRDPGLSATALEAVMATIIGPTTAPDSQPRSSAISLRAHLNGIAALSSGERYLMDELLARIAEAP
jgi:AcrR family transcriptional regulator